MNTARFHTADYVVLVGYFVLLLGVGVYFRRFMRQARDYFTGDNQVPWWLAGVSYFMTSFSAFAFIAYGEVAYKYGWVAVTLGWVAVPCCLVAAKWMAQRWRRARVDTPVEFLETRFSPAFRQLFAWTGFPLRVVDDALKLYSLGVFVSVAAGLDIIHAIVVSAAVILVYTFVGGIWAVAVTDFIQGIVLFVALLILLPLAFVRSGGWGAMAEAAPDAGWLHLANAPYSWAYVFGFFLVSLLNYNAGWALVQRFYSVRDEREARKVGYLATALKVVAPPLFYLPVLLARPLLPNLENTRYAYAATAVALLPVGMIGIMITAMFASTMSVLSAEYNVLASVATRDIYARLIRPGASEEHLLRVGRVCTALIGAVILGVGLLVASHPDAPLFGLMVTVFGIAVAPMMLPLLGGLLFPGLTRRGALAGFVVGLGAGLLTLAVQKLYLPGRPGLTPDWINFQFGAYAIFINIGSAVLAMLLWSLLERKDAAETARIAAFFERMGRPVEAPPPAETDRAAPSPFFITGLGVAGVGVILLLVAATSAGALARRIDAGAGAALLLCGLLLYRTRPRIAPQPAEAPPREPAGSAGALR